MATATPAELVAELQRKYATAAAMRADAESQRSQVQELRDTEAEILAKLEEAVAAENSVAIDAYADKVPTILGASYAALLQKLEALDAAATDVLVAARTHSTTVNDVKVQAQHLAAGATEGRIVDSRFGLTIDGKRISFESDAAAGAIARSISPVLRRLGQGCLSDSLQTLAASTNPLSIAEENTTKDEA